MLSVLMSWFWVHSLIYKWWKQTIYVSYSSELIVVQFLIALWLNQTLCGSYFTEVVLGLIGTWPVNKADNLW